MCDHDLGDALLERGVDDLEDLIAAEVTGRQHHPVPGDHRQHLARLGQDRPRLVDDGYGLDLDPLCAQLELEAHPHRHLRAGGSVALVGLVDRVHRRHPHDPGAFTGSDLDRQRVHAPHRAVQRDRPEHLDPGHRRPDHARSLRGRGVVRLEHEPGHPELLEAPGERDIVDLALDHVGTDVDVGVERPVEEPAGSL